MRNDQISSLSSSLLLEDLNEVSHSLLAVLNKRRNKSKGLLIVIRVEVPKHHGFNFRDLAVVDLTKSNNQSQNDSFTL